MLLAGAYGIRFSVAIAMTVSQASLAIAAAGPMFKLLGERAVNGSAFLFYSAAADLSAFLGTRAVTLILRRVLYRGTLIAFAATGVIAIFEDDALQKWCARTLYRGAKFIGEKPFDSAGEELGALYGAIREVI